jgi:hypothetical protein
VYPFGATLNVQKPAIPILSSGTVSYPLNRPIAAVCHSAVELKRMLDVELAFKDQLEWQREACSGGQFRDLQRWIYGKRREWEVV